MEEKDKGKHPTPDLVWRSSAWYESKTLHLNVHRMCNRDGFNPSQCIVRKMIKREKLEDKNARLPPEVQLLEKLEPNERIVHHLGLVEDPTFFTAIFPYYDAGDVHQWMQSGYPKTWVPESIIWRFLLQMTEALAFIHDRPSGDGEIVLHRDIKPRNILVTYDGDEPSFKLTDFGFAVALPKEQPERVTIGGTFRWQAPENPKINTKAADIWSMGACAYFLATRNRPVGEEPRAHWERIDRKGATNPRLVEAYGGMECLHAARTPRHFFPINIDRVQQLRHHGPGIYYRYSDELNSLMSRCLKQRRKDRPTTSQLLAEVRR